MIHAEKCSVCNGTGKVDNVQSADTVMHRYETCHGCNGKGWVEVGTDYPPYIPAPLIPDYLYPTKPYKLIWCDKTVDTIQTGSNTGDYEFPDYKGLQKKASIRSIGHVNNT